MGTLKCPLQVNKLIRENSAKNVNQTGNSYFRSKRKTAISPPIFNFFQYFFHIRDPISIITLTEKSKFEENCDLKVHGNLNRIFNKILEIGEKGSFHPEMRVLSRTAL